jgi:hypothetical protein
LRYGLLRATQKAANLASLSGSDPANIAGDNEGRRPRAYDVKLARHVDSTSQITVSALSNLGIPPMSARETKWSWWYLLLLIQFIPALWVPFYNFLEPSWAGIPVSDGAHSGERGHDGRRYVATERTS